MGNSCCKTIKNEEQIEVNTKILIEQYNQHEDDIQNRRQDQPSLNNSIQVNSIQVNSIQVTSILATNNLENQLQNTFCDTNNALLQSSSNNSGLFKQLNSQKNVKVGSNKNSQSNDIVMSISRSNKSNQSNDRVQSKKLSQPSDS